MLAATPSLLAIPPEIRTQILSWIPPENVVPLALVCSAFHACISNLAFANLNLTRTIAPLDHAEQHLEDRTIFLFLAKAPERYQRAFALVVMAQVTTLKMRLGQRRCVPTSICWIRSLSRLAFQMCNLDGPIPSELGNLKALTHLAMGLNSLHGHIPASVGSLLNLQHLSFSGNRLSGPIPIELGALGNLRALHLSSNDFTGGIPDELGRLSKLERLYLGSNSQLGGAIPVSFGNLESLRELDLDDCGLVGTIPVEFGRLTELLQLEMSDNSLWGEVPPELLRLPDLRVCDLMRNEGLTCSFPFPALQL
ncbi:hypothetical protein HDU98_000475 [Podochytrium sp. JEL0797]|nr:hypothetical protein HDU98_000475 [Podochytrium sp. JEL0797]